MNSIINIINIINNDTCTEIMLDAMIDPTVAEDDNKSIYPRITFMTESSDYGMAAIDNPSIETIMTVAASGKLTLDHLNTLDLFEDMTDAKRHELKLLMS